MTAPRQVDSDISVLIPTLGRDVLRQSVAALVAGTVWPARLLVVDQGSTPAVQALLEEIRRQGLETVWIPSRERGRSAGLNCGLRAVTTRFVAITDDDCLADPDWLERMAEWLRTRPDAIVSGRVEAGGDEVNLAVVTSREPDVQHRPRLLFDRLSGGNMGMAMEVVSRIGGFDDHASVRTAEDAEFAYRALRAGVPIIYAPDVALCHLGWREEAERLQQYESYARSHGGFYGKYLRRGDGFILLRASIHFARALRRWLLGLLRGRRELARNGRAYVTGLLPGILAGWRRGTAP